MPDSPDQIVQSPENSASLRLRTGPLAGPVLCRVVSMMLARANCPMDRLNDAMVICDAIAAHAPTHVLDSHLNCTVTVHKNRVDLRIDELSREGAQKLIEDAVLPGVGNVLERMTDELHPDPPGEEKNQESLFLSLGFDAE